MAPIDNLLIDPVDSFNSLTHPSPTELWLSPFLSNEIRVEVVKYFTQSYT